MKCIRTDVSEGGTSTVVGEGRESMANDWPEMVLDDALATGGVSAEPNRVPGRAARYTLKVRVDFIRICLGTGDGGVEL